jgi:predicted site-specific integrase-resolvase
MEQRNEKEKRYVTVGEASRLTGLDPQTIRKMADKASILCYKTPSGQRRINLQSIQKLCSNTFSNQEEQQSKKQNYLYVRVSTKKQLEDLSRQLDYVKRPEYVDYTIITDVGSGINFKRKGLSTILDSCLQGTVGEIVIAHKDRLCRFGFDLIEQLVTKSGGRITILNNQEDRTSEQELTEDLLSIIHVFSCRQMGRRNYKKPKNENSNSQDLSNVTTEESDR